MALLLEREDEIDNKDQQEEVNEFWKVSVKMRSKILADAQIGLPAASDITPTPNALMRTSWTDLNPGRRFWGCPKPYSTCGFIGWIDGPMCERSKHYFGEIADVEDPVSYTDPPSKKSKFIFPFDVENESELRFICWTGQSSFKGRKSKIWRIWRGVPKHLKKFKIKPSDFGNIVSEKV
ncbi:hypothetical protein LXL04_013373 [Taraxacum kok-saghyz]